jgi:hypothetical protein
MPATVSLSKLAITRIANQRYDGVVILNARASGIEFKYRHKFDGASDIKSAVVRAANDLKEELTALARQTADVLRSPEIDLDDQDPLDAMDADD